MNAPLLIKICGVKDRAAIDTAAAADATHIGFNFFPRSPRYVDPAAGAGLASASNPALKRVAVLVDPSDDEIAAARTAIHADIIQLHGAETPGRVADVKTRFGVDVWKALSVSLRADIMAADSFVAADAILFDAKPSTDATRTGGLGVTFDWSLLHDAHLKRPWILSGGLKPATVAEAIRATKARGVDVASGVETAPGVKSPDLIAMFSRNARMAFASAAKEFVP
jgi:phosphoribosylanthranilate isomerase